MEAAANGTTAATASWRRAVVLYPSPGTGHLFAMVELGRTLSARGLAVTILVADAPYYTGAPAVLADVSAANPSITFHRLLPEAYKHPEAMIMEAARAHNPQLRAFLASSSPAAAALVVDMFCGAALDVAEELGVPAYFFFTSGAAVLAFLLHLPAMHARAAASFGEMGEELVRVPGVPPFPATHVADGLKERDDVAYDGYMRVSAGLSRARGVIVNTFRSLEPRAVAAIAAGLCAPPGLPTPPVHCIGPLVKSQDLHVAEGGNKECLAWLDRQPKASVVFLCFGSLGRFSAEQTREVAAGLEASGQRFLWVVRAPPPNDDGDPAMKYEKPPEPDLDALLPDGFLRRTEDRGLVVKSWAPQREVLAHGAVGGFVTHCGWNSVLEAVMAGVPMLGWPLYAEQRFNRFLLEEEMRLTVPLQGCNNGFVAADEVAAKVRWLMDSDGRTTLRERTLAVMGQAKEALRKGGDSEAALARLVDSWRN
ncbi:hypothetical protein EJB05_28669, partial [Eragrostis curvula]